MSSNRRERLDRAHAQAGGEKLPLASVIEADEIYVGGKATNRQKHRDKSTRGRGTDKPMIFAAIERGGEARVAVDALTPLGVP